MKKYFILLFISLFLKGISQKANNWYFGNGAGLNFTGSNPTALTNGQTIAPDNTSSISDASGNLLFYTNGVTVWNKNHLPMPNGSGLIGHNSAGQCALIVPFPCDANKFIIFQVTEYSAPGNLNYSVVDMTLAGGLGDIIIGKKNIFMGSGFTEKLCAYYNPVGNFYWLFTHKWNSNQFVGFKVDALTIGTQSVVSSIGSIHNCGSYGGTHDAMGQLTISPDGSKIINALTCQDKYELFNLNISSGVLSNSISINSPGGNAWGTAFSPDNKKLYVSGLSNPSIFQFDLSSNNQSTINGSQTSVLTTTNGGFGYMEMGPDSLVYISKPGSSILTVINSPNNTGAGSNISLSGPSLGINTSSHGLSRIAYNIPLNNGNPLVTISNSNSNNLLCTGQSATLTASGANTFTWSTSATGAVLVVTPNITSSYTVTGATDNCSASAAITVSVTDCTALNETMLENGVINVYPNPLSDKLNVEINASLQGGNLEITNVLGQLVYADNYIVSCTIDLGLLPSGLYFLHIKKERNQEIKRLIKN